MLLQHLRELSTAPGGLGRIWQYIEGLVITTTVSGLFRGGCRTDLYFATISAQIMQLYFPFFFGTKKLGFLWRHHAGSNKPCRTLMSLMSRFTELTLFSLCNTECFHTQSLGLSQIWRGGPTSLLSIPGTTHAHDSLYSQFYHSSARAWVPLSLALICSQSAAMIGTEVSIFHGLRCERYWEQTTHHWGLVFAVPQRQLFLYSRVQHLRFFHYTRVQASLNGQPICSRCICRLCQHFCPSCTWPSQDTRKMVAFGEAREQS